MSGTVAGFLTIAYLYVSLLTTPSFFVYFKMCLRHNSKGDCDIDDDCDGNLVCFQREEGGGAVPGCVGGEEAVSRTDFCVRPVALSQSGQARNGDGGSSTLSFETSGSSFTSSHPDDFSGATSTTLILGGIAAAVASFLLTL